MNGDKPVLDILAERSLLIRRFLQSSGQKSQQVDQILQQIEGLNEADRLLLVERLDDLHEARWQAEAAEARQAAARRGLDQRTIDCAVEDLRFSFGPRRGVCANKRTL